MPLTREQKKNVVDLLLRIPSASSFEGRTALLGDGQDLTLNRNQGNARLDLEGIVQQLEQLRADDVLATVIENAIRHVPGTGVAGELDPLLQAAKIASVPATAVGMTLPKVRVVPNYPDAETRRLSELLEAARERQARLARVGADTSAIKREILDLRRQLREGGVLRAGDSLSEGRYLLLEQVGRGGFASVWLGLDRNGMTHVAIKVLHPNLALDPTRRERFFRGARVMADLRHDAVVRVLNRHGEDGGYHYFVMDFVEGMDLRRTVLKKELSESEVIPLILRIGDALAEAHAKGIVHRDVKPANILLDKGRNAWLTDFDLAGVDDTTGGTRTGALGTFLFAAPEMMDHPENATARADVYGLAMTATFCFYGKDLPRSAFGNAVSLVNRLSCSKAIKAVLARSVALEEAERFSNARELCNALLEATGRKGEATERGHSERAALEHQKRSAENSNGPRKLLKAGQTESKSARSKKKKKNVKISSKSTGLKIRYSIPEISKKKILDAMVRIDRALDKDPKAFVRTYRSGQQRYYVEYDGRRYPVKLIVSLATGMPHGHFTGGELANRRMTEQGFTVVEISKALDKSGFLADLAPGADRDAEGAHDLQTDPS